MIRRVVVAAVAGAAVLAVAGWAAELWSRRFDPDARLDEGAGRG